MSFLPCCPISVIIVVILLVRFYSNLKRESLRIELLSDQSFSLSLLGARDGFARLNSNSRKKAEKITNRKRKHTILGASSSTQNPPTYIPYR